MTQSIHGLHHSAYIYQIANGIIPPTNPSSMEAPANFYWGWHALAAALMGALEISAFEALLLMNTLSLATLLGFLWLAAGRWTGSAWRRLGICLLPFFILNPIGMTQFAGRAGEALGPTLVQSLRAGEGIQPSRLQAAMRDRDGLDMHSANSAYLMPLGWESEVQRSKRVGNLLIKFFGFSSFPSAVALFAAALVALSLWRGAFWRRCALLTVASAGMAIFSPMVALAFGALVAAHCAVYTLEFEQRRSAARRAGHAPLRRKDLVRDWLPALAAGAGILAALPYLLDISSAFGGRSELLLGRAALLRHAGTYGWALLPSLSIHAAAIFWLPRLGPAPRTYWLGGLLLLVGTLCVRVPTVDPNEYKLGLLASIPAALLLAGLLAELDISGFPGPRSSRWLGAGITVALVAGGLLAVATTSLLFLPSPWRDQSTYRYDGTAIDLDVVRARRPPSHAERADLQRAYRWLRENTPPTAYVAVRPLPKDDLELSTVAQRRIVAALPSVFTKKIRHHKRLVRETREVMDRLGECRLRPRELRRLFEVPAPWPEEIYALVRIDQTQLRNGPRCERSWSGAVKAELLSAHYAVFRIDVEEGRRGASETRTGSQSREDR
ncbi:MAG: hypothetical protein JRH19_24435 [Deltaproteobacteria bacterium]|nr:hypothetical protein [Deltaproteobacteria bacterium]